MKKIFFSIFILLAVITVQQTEAQDINSSLPFLNIGPDAYSLSLSEARTATLTGASDLYNNPANLALEKKSSLDASYTFWIADTRISHASINFRRKNDAFAFGVLTSSVNNIEARQQPGPAIGTFSMQDFSVAAAYARRIGPFSLGGNIQYLYEQFYQQKATGYAFSFGSSLNLLRNRLRLGAAFKNIGHMNKLGDTRSELPTNLNFGAHMKVAQFSTPGNSEIPVVIALSADYVKPLHNKAINNTVTSNSGLKSLNNGFFTSGVNIDIAQLIELRGGYRFSSETSRKTSWGLGVMSNGIHIDFAYVPFSTGFGNAYSIELRYYF